MTAEPHLSFGLNSLKGVIQGIIWGSVVGAIKGDTRSLDYGSYAATYVRVAAEI